MQAERGHCSGFACVNNTKNAAFFAQLVIIDVPRRAVSWGVDMDHKSSGWEDLSAAHLGLIDWESKCSAAEVFRAGPSP